MQGKSLLIASLFAVSSSVTGRAQTAVTWITQYGTDQYDAGQSIVVDPTGRSWVNGYTEGDLAGPQAGEGDIVLSRISAGGVVDFFRQRGGTAYDDGYGIALVGNSTVFAGGFTESKTFDGANVFGALDGLALRYDTSGTWQATTLIGRNGGDLGYGMAGGNTHLLVAGIAGSAFDNQNFSGNDDAFLSKRDSTGALVWTRFVGSSEYDEGLAAAFDSAGNGYLSGSTAGSLSGATNAGSHDLYVARFDSSGTQTLLKQFGTVGYDIAYDMKVDSLGNIYLTGSTDGGLNGQLNAGFDDAFVMKLDSNGNVLWTRLFGGSDYDSSFGLGLDSSGHVWIGGRSYSTFGDHTNGGGGDGFVTEFDSAGNLLGTTWLATSSYDSVNALAIGPGGAIFVTGETDGSLGAPNAGGSDAFVARIVSVPEPGSAILALIGAGTLLTRRRVVPASR